MALTLSELWNIYDNVANTYDILAGLSATTYLNLADQYRIGNGSGQPNGLGYTNWAVMSTLGSLIPIIPCDITNNINTSQKAITNLNSYFASAGNGSLNGYLTTVNTGTYGSAYAKPNLAILYALALGYNPLTSISTSQFLSPGNVEAPVISYGTFSVSGTGGNTYKNYTSCPYANNSAAVNCVQNLIITASGGTFTVQIGNNPNNVTSALAYNISAADLATAINALIPLYNSVTVGAISGGFAITFINNCANQVMPLLTINPASLTGGTAYAYVATIGSQQGYLPPALTTVSVTTTFNGTYSFSLSGAAINSTGTYHASGRTFTCSLSSVTSGTVVNLTPGTSGDRLVSVTSLSTSGTATAGAATIVSTMDR